MACIINKISENIVGIVSICIALFTYLQSRKDMRPQITIEAKYLKDHEFKIGSDFNVETTHNKRELLGRHLDGYFSNLEFKIHNSGPTDISDVYVSFDCRVIDIDKLNYFKKFMLYKYGDVISNLDLTVDDNSNQINHINIDLNEHSDLGDTTSYVDVFHTSYLSQSDDMSINIPMYYLSLWQLYLLFKFESEPHQELYRYYSLSDIIQPYIVLRYKDSHGYDVVNSFDIHLTIPPHYNSGGIMVGESGITSSSILGDKVTRTFNTSNMRLYVREIYRKESTYVFSRRRVALRLYSLLYRYMFVPDNTAPYNHRDRFRGGSVMYKTTHSLRRLLKAYLYDDGLKTHDAYSYGRVMKFFVNKYNNRKINRAIRNEFSRIKKSYEY